AIRPDGRIGPLSLGLWSDTQIPGMARLAAAIKAEGAVAVVQLNHAGARSIPVEGGIRGASPSGVAFRADVDPTVLSEAQIAEITGDFVAAASRARAAGFDGVEIHGAHLYLLSQFLSPLTNRRTDRYGGGTAGRAQFAVEVVRAVRCAVGAAFLVFFRLNAIEFADGGQTSADAAAVAASLEEAGADAIDASILSSGEWKEVEGKTVLAARSALAKEQARGTALPAAQNVKRGVRIPVIGVGKLGPSEARTAIESGMVDLVAIGRQMIADPGTIGKVLEGRDEEIVLCKECWSCFACTGKGIPLVCSTNRNLTGEPLYTKGAKL
ncbi:MAG TPA: NADH:flavin oxidoreductase, partial [Chloroflexota bacterium]